MQTYANQPTYSFIDWHKLFLGKKKFSHGFWFVFFVLYFWFCSHPGLHWSLCPSNPVPWEGKVTLLRWAHQTRVWCPTSVESTVLGTSSPRDKIFAWGKAALPRAGCQKTNKGQASSSPYRLTASTRQESWQSSFFFSERTYTSSPSASKQFPPAREKLQDPRGPSTAKTRSCKRSSHGLRIASPSMKNLGFKLEVIGLNIAIHVGQTNRALYACSAYALRMRELKKRRKKQSGGIEPRPPGLRAVVQPTVLAEHCVDLCAS